MAMKTLMRMNGISTPQAIKYTSPRKDAFTTSVKYKASKLKFIRFQIVQPIDRNSSTCPENKAQPLIAKVRTITNRSTMKFNKCPDDFFNIDQNMLTCRLMLIRA